MTEPVRVEDEIAELDFEPQCEVVSFKNTPLEIRCAESARFAVTTHWCLFIAAYDPQMKLAVVCARHLEMQRAKFEAAKATGDPLVCVHCGLKLRSFSDLVSRIVPL